MLRPWMLTIPAVSAAAAAAGALAPGRAVVVTAAAGLAGLALAAGLARRERRARTAVGERERVTRLLEELPGAVLLFDDTGLAYANPAARVLFATEREAERSPFEILGVRALADAVAEAGETGAGVEIETERGERYLLARASVSAGGEVALVVTDLTEIRRLQAVRRDFVTNASHELKTPVAGIQALSESLPLALARDPERAHRMVDRLGQEAARLGQLVRDLLDLARLEEDAGRGRRQRVDVAEVAATQAARTAPAAAERGVKVQWECPRPARVVAVPHDVRLIVDNLLENAVRYNGDGGEVRVRVRRLPGAVELEVADTGIGIPEAEQARVFERFYRIDKGRSRLEGGTGLGLALVRHAVARHGGRVELRSEPGAGSTFTVTLPVEGAEGP